MNRYTIVFVCCVALLFATAAAFVFALRNHRQVRQPPAVPPSLTSAEVRVKAIGQKNMVPVRSDAADASASIAVICGHDAATADSYDVRSDALRSIAMRANLPKNDVLALVSYIASTCDVLRVERTAALKNDVMNLLRRQSPPPECLADVLVSMFESGNHPPAVLDYCIQHLGMMQNCIEDTSLRVRVRAVFETAADRRTLPYAGTALFALAEDNHATAAQEAKLKRLALVLCRPPMNPAARVAAFQLSGERGYREMLPFARQALDGISRDIVVGIAAAGAVGLLGGQEDIPLLEEAVAKGGRRCVPAVNAAIGRIRERHGNVRD